MKQIIDVSKKGGVSEKAFKYLCRHLVALVTSYQIVNKNGQPQDKSEALLYSGCILSIRNTWFFLTAGHILKSIERDLNDKRIRFNNWRILDDFGPDTISHQSIPFDFVNSEKCYIDEDGLDFGIIALHNNYRRLLEANGIVPISEDNWRYQNNVEYDEFIMLGLPTKFINSEVADIQNLLVSYAPTMIRIKEIHKKLPETKFPRFQGKIDEKCVLDDIDGMSGGPIFGFSKRQNERYWIVAIQSSWRKDKKIIFACPVQILAGLIEKCDFSYITK